MPEIKGDIFTFGGDHKIRRGNKIYKMVAYTYLDGGVVDEFLAKLRSRGRKPIVVRPTLNELKQLVPLPFLETDLLEDIAGDFARAWAFYVLVREVPDRVLRAAKTLKKAAALSTRRRRADKRAGVTSLRGMRR